MTFAGHAPVTLSAGSHRGPEDGMCLMEFVSLLAGERFTDRPRCASPLITGLAIAINDVLPGDADRTRWLVPLASGIVGTRGDEAIEQARAFACADAAIRRFAPLALDVAGRWDEAAKLRTAGQVYDERSATAAVHVAEESVESCQGDIRAAVLAARETAQKAAATRSSAIGPQMAHSIRSVAYAAAIEGQLAIREKTWAEASRLIGHLCTTRIAATPREANPSPRHRRTGTHTPRPRAQTAPIFSTLDATPPSGTHSTSSGADRTDQLAGRRSLRLDTILRNRVSLWLAEWYTRDIPRGRKDSTGS